MGLFKTQIVEDYSLHEANKTIFQNYHFNCKKCNSINDSYIIYEGNKEYLKKIYEAHNISEKEKVDVAINFIGSKVTDKVIVSGGHTVVDLSNKLHAGEESIKSTNFTFDIISKLQTDYNKKAEFLIQLNDIYMEYDPHSTSGTISNQYREQALKPYVIPCSINEILKKRSKELNRTFDLYYCSSKNLSDTFKRHIKTAKKNNSQLFNYKENESEKRWDMLIDGEPVSVLVNDKPNCVSANAAMLRSIRYLVDNRRQKDNFTSYVGIFPLCSMDNVLNGYKVANKFYGLDLPTYFIFTGTSCF